MMSKRKSNIRTDGMTEKQDTNHTKIQIKKKNNQQHERTETSLNKNNESKKQK